MTRPIPPSGQPGPVVDSGLNRIPTEEIRERQHRFQRALTMRDLPGAIVISRGASTQDCYADVFYLSNFYSHYPSVPDEKGRWRAKGYVALVVPASGPITAVTDLGAFRRELICVDEVVTDQDVIGAVGRVVKATLGSATGRLGVLGTVALAWPWARYLEDTLDSELVGLDEVGVELRTVKSPAEISLLRAAGLVGSRGVEAVMEAAVAGATEAEVARAGFSEVIGAGGMVFGMSLSTGPWAHTYSQPQPAPFDSRRRLEAGDMVRVDFYGSVDGYLFDFGRTRVVGRPPDERQQELISAARDSVQAGISRMRSGVPLCEVAAAASESYAKSAFGRRGKGLAPEFESWGHSLGLNWEAPYIDAAARDLIRPGMCLAIEKRTADPNVGGATYEENVLIGEDGIEILSVARESYGEEGS